ncbi:MAG: response regulator [Spirochaetota bacterium]
MGFDVKKTILLVEDEYLPATHEKLQLEKHGYKVVMANSGETAIKALNGNPSIDLVLMDIHLADGSDGFLVAESILKDHEIPIVFVLGHQGPEVMEKLEKGTYYGYVFKQSSVAALDSAIKMALRLFNANKTIETGKQRLHATLDAFVGLLLEVDADGNIHHIQAHHHERLLKPTAGMAGKRIQEVLSPTVAQILMDAIKEAHETTGWKLESTIVDGIVRWFELSVSRIASYQDIPRFIVISRDITNKYTADEKVRAS